MSEVKRYEFQYGDYLNYMGEDVDGKWVGYKDYKELEIENKDLKEQIQYFRDSMEEWKTFANDFEKQVAELRKELQ